MKKLLFLISLVCSVSYAEGPMFWHKNTAEHQEFENIYQDLRDGDSKYVPYTGANTTVDLRSQNVKLSTIVFSGSNLYLSTGTSFTVFFSTDGRMFLGSGAFGTENISTLNPNEMLRVERYANGSDSSVDIAVANTGNGGARFVISAGTKTTDPAAYVATASTGVPGYFWSGGPLVANSNYIAFQNGTKAVIYGVDQTGDWWLRNPDYNGNFHFIVNTTEILTVHRSSITMNGEVHAKGTTSNDNARNGDYGEYISTTMAPLGIPVGGSGVYTDMVSTTIAAGDYDCTGIVYMANNASVITYTEVLMNNTAGNNTTGTVYGNTRVGGFPPNANADGTYYLPNVRMSFSSPTAVYLKGMASYAGAIPKIYGRLSCRRVR